MASAEPLWAVGCPSVATDRVMTDASRGLASGTTQRRAEVLTSSICLFSPRRLIARAGRAGAGRGFAF